MTVALKTNSDNTSPLMWLGSLFDFVFPTLLFLICLGTFTRFGIDSVGWLAIYAVTAYQVVNNYEKFLKSAISSWLILVIPILTLISTFWSAIPGHTFSVSIQFIYTTVIGIWLGLAYSPYKIFMALFIATGIGVIASLINGYVHLINAYSEFDGFFIGIYNHKNTLGRIIVFLSISMLVVGINKGRLLIATILASLLVIPLLATESSTSLLMYLMVMSVPIIWLIANSNDTVRMGVTLGIVGFILLLTALLTVVEIDLVEKVLEKLGKDSTLTGRTYIWSIGWQMFEWKPILGLGFDAFWHAGTFDELRLIYSAYGDTINGFHNAFIEVLVSLGLVGEAAFIVTMTYVLYKASSWFYAGKSIESLGALTIIVIIFITSFLEIVGFRNHDINHILFVCIFVQSIGYHQSQKNKN